MSILLDCAFNKHVQEIRPLAFVQQHDVVGKALKISRANQLLEAAIVEFLEQWNFANSLRIRGPHISLPVFC